MPRGIWTTRVVDDSLKAQPAEVRQRLAETVELLSQVPQTLEGCPVGGHPELREWLFDAAGKTWRITIDVQTRWPDWHVMTAEEFRPR